MFYKFVKVLLRIVFLFIFRIKKSGTENVPKDCGAIFAANHQSNWDALVLAITSPRRLCFMAKSELFKNKLFASLMRSLGAFPVQRGKGDISAIKTSLSILKSQKCMLMFPEGKRVAKGEKAEAKPGVAMIASRAKVPVVPVTIRARYRWFGRVEVIYGEPIYFDEYYDEKLPMEKLLELSSSVMQRVYSQK